MALKQNIIYIYFKGKHQVTSKSQYQYNRKQYLYFADLNLPQVFEVHFSNRDKGESKTQIGSDNLVEIPDEYFWNGALQIYAWIYLHSGADDSETIYEIRIPLTKRAKPTDEEPLPVQQSTIDRAIAELNNAVNVTTENANKTESDKIIVANIKDEVVDLKEDIDSTATTINQKAQDAIDASGRAEASALNAADSERKALNYSQQAEQSAQEALESKNIAKQKAEIATGASAEALGYRDEAVSARDIAVQAKQNIVDYRDETKGYRDETLNLKNNVQTLKNQIDETAEEIKDASDAVKEDAQSASQSASSANQSSINASESASQAGQFADGAEQSANQAEQSMNTTEDYKNQSETYKTQAETFKNQAEEFKNQTETNVTHYPKIIGEYWYVWDVTNGEYINTNVDANGIKGDKGNGIQSAVLNNDYTLTLTFTDGTTYTTPSIRGEKGEQGEPATDMEIHICSASEYDVETRIPTIANPNDKTFYLVPTEDGTSPDLFTEWVYVNNAWEMFGSASVDLTDYVKNTDIATTTKAGIVKINPTYGVGLFNDTLVINGALANEVKAGNNSTKAVSTYRQHESTFYGLAKASGDTTQSQSDNPVGQYTDEAKSSIQDMLDVSSTSELKEVNDSKADVIVESANGDIVSFDDGADDMPLKSLVVNINPVQDLNGYDSPWVGGGGKNLFDKTLMRDREAWYNIAVKVKPSTKYTMSTDKVSEGLYIFFNNTNAQGGGSGNSVYGGHSVTVTSTEDGYVYVSQRRVSGDDSFQNYHWQIEEGSTATDWTPYENICPINGWNGVDIVATGYNIWDEEWEQGRLGNGIPLNHEQGFRSKNYISIKPNTTYYFNSGTTASGNFWFSYYTKDKKYITGTNSSGTILQSRNQSFTTPSNAYYLKFFVSVSTEYTNDISINYPSTDYSYHTYTGQTFSVSIPTEVGTVYGGKLNVLNGVLTVTHSYVQLPTTGWSLSGSNFWRSYSTMSNTNPANVGWCTHYANETRVIGNNTIIFGYSSFSETPRIVIRDSRFTTTSDFMAFLAEQETNGTPVMIAYPLATPIEIQLTPHEITSLLGHNTIYANTGNTSVEYCADTELYIEKVKPVVNVDDVQINNTSIVNDGIANIPLATADTSGLVKADVHANGYRGGIATIDNKLYVVGSALEGIKYGGDYSKPVVAGNQHYSTFYGLAKAAGADEKDSTLAFGTYSDNAKSSIQNMLGITDKYSPKEWMAESETELVTNAHNIGDLFYIGETLYKVIADLNAGDAVNVGVNVEEVNVNNILDDYATKEDVQDNVSIVEKSTSGSIASFDDGMDDMPLKSLTVDINPVQDLHGYDSPWIGGGKNLFDLKNAVLAVGYNGAFRANGYSQVNVYTTDTGIASDEKNTNCGRAVCLGLLPTGTYILSYVNNSGVTLSFTVSYTTTDVVPQDGQLKRTSVVTTNDQSIQFEADGSSYYWFGAYSQSAESYKIDNIMVRLATESDATYVPYENICPISGWTEANVTHFGKNCISNGAERKTITTSLYAKYTPVVSLEDATSVTFSVSADVPSGQTLKLYGLTGGGDNTQIGILELMPDGRYALTGVNKIKTVKEFRIYSQPYTGGSSVVTTVWDCSCVVDETRTDYIPYQGKTIPINWETGAGTVYSGRFDVISGVLTVDKYAEDLSQKTWSTRYTGSNHVTLSTSLTNAYPRAKGNQIISEKYALDSVVGASSLSNPDDKNVGLYWYNNASSLTPTPSVIYVIANVNTIPSGLVVYPLAEPITYQLTPTQVKSFLGINNIFADTGNTSVEYFSQVDKDLIDYIETSLKPYAKEERLNDYISDVQVNGTSIVTNGVANIPIAGTSGQKGVISIANPFSMQGSALLLTTSNSARIKSGTDSIYPLVSSRQHESVFYGLAKASGDSTQSTSDNAVGTYTDEAKTAIKQMLGIHDTIDSFVEEVTGTDVTITGQPSYRYNCGELYSLTVTPPSSGTIDIRFTSGSTPTVLTLPSTVKMPEWWVEVEANTIYEMCITDGIYCGVMTWAI